MPFPVSSTPPLILHVGAEPFVICQALRSSALPSKITASLTSFDRGGGVMQSAWKGHPLYLFATDKQPGDVKGDKVGNVWFVVNPLTLQ